MPEKKLHILFWNEWYLPTIGGVELFTARLADLLMRRGHRVSVVADHTPSNTSEFEILDGVPIYRFPFRKVFQSLGDGGVEGVQKFAGIVERIKSLKQDLQPDIAHINFTGPAALFHFRTLGKSTSQTVVTFQTALFDQSASVKGLVPTILNNARSVVAVSDAAARNIWRHTGFPLDKISIVFPGVPDELFIERSRKNTVLPTVVFLGRLVHDKGVDTVIQAMSLLKQRVIFNVIGDGPERPVLEALARKLGLRDIVHFAGHVNDDMRRDMLASAHVMVVPSRHEELFGMVAVEGALSGLPVIAARSGGLPEVVSNGETGIVVPPENPSAWAQALDRLFTDPQLAARMGKSGRERALREFSFTKTVDRYERIYFDALNRADG